MIVVVLSNCPVRLRGDLTKWMFEINTNVYVGQFSARVRDELWDRICENVRTGQATMVFSAPGEQKMDFRVHNTTWEPIDLDGIKLMLRPSPDYLEKKAKPVLRPGFSKAAQQRKVKRAAGKRPRTEWEEYVVLDLETTGLSYTEDSILEAAALLVREGKPVGSFQVLFAQDRSVPREIVELTGITDELIKKEGIPPGDAILRLKEFIGERPLVCHNGAFDLTFLQYVCRQHRLDPIRNPYSDTLVAARKKLKGLSDWKLVTIAKHFGLDTTGAHRAVKDCQLTFGIYEKLKQM